MSSEADVEVQVTVTEADDGSHPKDKSSAFLALSSQFAQKQRLQVNGGGSKEDSSLREKRSPSSSHRKDDDRDREDQERPWSGSRSESSMVSGAYSPSSSAFGHASASEHKNVETNSTSVSGSSSSAPDGYRVNRWGLVVAADPASVLKRRNERLAPRAVEQLQTDRSREDKWLKMTRPDFVSYMQANYRQCKRRFRKGIPDSFRALIWPLLSGADVRKKEFPHLFAQLAASAADGEVELQIKKDKKRTMQQHVLFRGTAEYNNDLDVDDTSGQGSLFAVLKAFAQYKPSIGYCQGMSSAAAIFISYLQDVDAFWMLERVLCSDKYGNFGAVFEPGFPLLFQMLYCHEAFMLRLLPKLLKHFRNKGIDTTLYVFFVVFARSLRFYLSNLSIYACTCLD